MGVWLYGFNDYEEALCAINVKPNFWCSREMFEARQCRVTKKAGVITVEAKGYGTMLPSVDMVKGALLVSPVWADVEGYDAGPGYVSQILDREYIYRAGDVATFGDRVVFHKNVRHFERLYHDCKYETGLDSRIMLGVLVQWLEERGIKQLEGYNEILWFGEHRTSCAALMVKGIPIVTNVWDSNRSMINFRYCFALRGYPFASEFARWCFYKAFPEGTIVNDGGDLGSAALAAFKRKLGPMEIRQRYTWVKRWQ